MNKHDLIETMLALRACGALGAVVEKIAAHLSDAEAIARQVADAMPTTDERELAQHAAVDEAQCTAYATISKLQDAKTWLELTREACDDALGLLDYDDSEPAASAGESADMELGR